MINRQKAVQALRWIEANTTLHNQVKIIYVVDGIEVCVERDESCISPIWRGENVFEALLGAADSGFVAPLRAPRSEATAQAKLG